MKLHIIVLLFLFIALSSNSQDRSDHNSDSKTSYINVSLGSIADPFAPRLRFGYIQYVAPHWKVGLDAGYGNEQLSLTTETNIGVDYSLWENDKMLHLSFIDQFEQPFTSGHMLMTLNKIFFRKHLLN